MAITLKLSDTLIGRADPYAAVRQRSVPKQIEYRAPIGKAGEGNLDLPVGWKKNGLAGMRVYNYRGQTKSRLVAYRMAQDEGTVKALRLGFDENFYCGLKCE